MADEHNRILKILHEKIILKEEVFEKTQAVFNELKSYMSKLVHEIKSSVKDISKSAPVNYADTGKFEAQLTLADETLLVVMHTNIFTFDNNHEIWRNKYVQQDNKRAFCGKIFIYNFLTDSFKYNRSSDVGYLLARIFVNREGHFFIEGKKQLGYSYAEFANNVFNPDSIAKVVESAIIYSLDFDPFTPPFEQISMLSVKEVQESELQSRVATGRRLGFQFSSEGGDIN